MSRIKMVLMTVAAGVFLAATSFVQTPPASALTIEPIETESKSGSSFEELFSEGKLRFVINPDSRDLVTIENVENEKFRVVDYSVLPRKVRFVRALHGKRLLEYFDHDSDIVLEQFYHDYGQQNRVVVEIALSQNAAIADDGSPTPSDQDRLAELLFADPKTPIVVEGVIRKVIALKNPLETGLKFGSRARSPDEIRRIQIRIFASSINGESILWQRH